nr:ketoacyl-ACP synthase III [uncultured Capnocytophaga sp.]
MMKSYIKAISTYFPKNILTNDAISAQFPEWNSEKILQKIGIEQRYIAQEDECASDMAAKAVLNLIEEHHLDKNTIDFLLLYTQTPDHILPTTACIVQEKAGLPTSCAALDINQGCSGYIYGLSLASSLIASGNFKNVVLVTADTYTKYIHPKDKGNLSIFGDAATATLVSTEGAYCIGKPTLGTDGAGAENLIIRNGGTRSPRNENPDDLDNFVDMKGGKIFNFIIKRTPEVIYNNLKTNNLDIKDIDLFVFHQANTHILNKVREEMEIPEEKFVIEMRYYGNTISSTIPIAFSEHLGKYPQKASEKIQFVGFGVGYSWGAICIEKS